MMLQSDPGACSTFFKRRVPCDFAPVEFGEVLVGSFTVPIPKTLTLAESISVTTDVMGV